MNKEYSIRGAIRDSIGLGMSKDKLVKFKLGEIPMHGVLCSSNTRHPFVPSNSERMDCWT
jgi:hypothetical protein